MKLNKEQYRAAVHVDGPMLVLAGPGSGKTHLLVERIRMMIEDHNIRPECILVITFSKKAASQMQARFSKRVEGHIYPVTFGTFHAVFYRILQDFSPDIKRLITEEEQRRFVKSLMCKMHIFDEYVTEDDVLAMISSYLNLSEVFFERNEFARDMDDNIRAKFKQLVRDYKELCRINGVIDFDDMIIMCRDVFLKHEMFLRKMQKRYRYFLVDEFQDINEAQYDVLRLLAGDDKNVFAVGDDDQSIYGFRGARPDLMKKFMHQYNGCKKVTLTMNYRCFENVIGVSDTVIRNNTDRLERPMQRHLPSKKGGKVIITKCESTLVQAEFVCDRIEEILKNDVCKPHEIAVLYRSGHCASMLVDTAKKRGIPLSVYGISKEPSGKKIHEAYLRAHEGRASRADFFLIMNNPERGLSREALCIDTGKYIDDLIKFYSDDKEKLKKVYELLQMIRQYDCEDSNYTNDTSDGRKGVNVMTAHASKGLEFRYVFIIGLQEGLFPHHKNLTGESVYEERRLMYVAMTRAIECLYMCTVSTEHGKRESRFAKEAQDMKYITDIYKLTRTFTE